MTKEQQRNYVLKHGSNDLVCLYDLYRKNEKYSYETLKFVLKLKKEGLLSKDDCIKYFEKDGYSLDINAKQKTILKQWLNIKYIGFSKYDINKARKMICDQDVVQLLRQGK